MNIPPRYTGRRDFLINLAKWSKFRPLCCAKEPILTFDPADVAGAGRAFAAQGFVVLRDALSAADIAKLTAFSSSSKAAGAWSSGDITWQYSQPLLDTDSLDAIVRPIRTFAVIEATLGGTGSARFSELTLREVPARHVTQKMHLHRDRALPFRAMRAPYFPPDYVCAITYLTDVDTSAPTFFIIPNSSLIEPPYALDDAVPVRGPAGTMILYDISLIHTRVDPDVPGGHRGRLTLHTYYARGGFERPECWDNNLRSKSFNQMREIARPPSPALTDWVLIPPRLACNIDPKTRLFFSHWSTAQGEWAAAGFPPLRPIGSHVRMAPCAIDVDRTIAHYSALLPPSRNICDPAEAAMVLSIADDLLASPLPLQALATEAYLRADTLPPLFLLALKAAESRVCLHEVPPCHITVVVPMWHETYRLVTRAESPEGQDALRWKARQLDWLCGWSGEAAELSQGTARYTWDIIAIDDGCDQRSAATAAAIIKEESRSAGLAAGGRINVVRLADCIGQGAQLPLSALSNVDDSSRGGAIAAGLARAVVQARKRKVATTSADDAARETIILYTDADLQTDLTQAGSLAHRLLVGGCSCAVGVRYGYTRSAIVKPPSGAVTHPRSHSEQHNALQITLRHWLRSTLLPEIAGICDINAGFKAFRVETLVNALPHVTQFRKAFDIELLMLCAVQQRRGPLHSSALYGAPAKMIDSSESSTLACGIGVVPIIFVEDSAVSKPTYAENTTSSLNDFLSMAHDAARLYRAFSDEKQAGDEVRDVLNFIDSLNVSRYAAVLVGLEKKFLRRAPPLSYVFDISELVALADSADKKA